MLVCAEIDNKNYNKTVITFYDALYTLRPKIEMVLHDGMHDTIIQVHEVIIIIPVHIWNVG